MGNTGKFLCIRVPIRPGWYLEVPAALQHGGSEKPQPDRVYMLASRKKLTKAQEVAVKLSAEYIDYHGERVRK